MDVLNMVTMVTSQLDPNERGSWVWAPPTADVAVSNLIITFKNKK